MEYFKLLIVGAGAAGMSAAISAWEHGAESILLVDRAERPGGVLPRCIHRGFGLSGFGEELTGPDYAQRIIDRLALTGAELCLRTTVLRVTPERTAILMSGSGLREIRFDQMILATGCRERSIGSLPVAGTRPSGIYTAGQAQELINLRGQDVGDKVVIVGSGDLGMIMARRFVLTGKRVIAVIEKEAHYGGMARNYRRCIEKYAVPIRYATEIACIHGTRRIEGVTVRSTVSGEEDFIPCETLVTALGLIPDRALVSTLGSPGWLHLCGNCSRVHDIADSAVNEAVRVAGRLTGNTEADR